MNKQIVSAVAAAVIIAGLIITPYMDSYFAEGKHFRQKWLGSLLKLSFTNVAVEIPMSKALYNGEDVYIIHTEASDKDMAEMITEMIDFKVAHAPLLAKAPRDAVANVYVFENGIEGEGPLGFQMGVFDSTPAQVNDYSALRVINTVKWNDGAEARTLGSVQEITDAKANGELTITDTGVVVNAPMIKWPDGQMMVKEDKRISDDTPYVGGQVTNIDTDAMKVTFVAHRGWGPDGKSIYYIVTDATPEMPAQMMGVVYAPKNEKLSVSAAAIDLFQFTNGISGSGPMGFQAGIGGANVGDPNYSPMWKISFITWNKAGDARILQTLSDIGKMNRAGMVTVEPAMDGRHIVNCPFIEV